MKALAIVFSAILAWGMVATSAHAETTAERAEVLARAAKELAPIELKEFEIRAKIYEPQVVYILDRARLDVDFPDDEVSFSSRIPEPVVENQF